MKSLLKKFCIYLTPFVIIAVLFLTFSPFDYFSLRDDTNYDAKPMTDMRSLMKDKPDKIILGDSRMANLNVDYINEITEEDYLSLAFGGANMGESIALFWFATEHTQLTKVVFGVGWYTSNGEQTPGKIPAYAKEVTNPLNFLSDYNNWTYTLWRMRVATRNAAADLFNQPRWAIDDPDPRALDTLPPMNVEGSGLWRQDIMDYGNIIYSNLDTIGYELRDDTLAQLQEVIDYCDQNGIELIFVFPPMHDVLFYTVTPHMNIDVYRERYKRFLIERATVFDFEFQSGFNSNDRNFVDGFHLTGAGKMWLSQVIFTDMETPDVNRYYKD